MSIVKTNKFQTLDGLTYSVPVQIVKVSLGENYGTTSNDQTNNQPAWALSSNTTTWTNMPLNQLQLTITPKFSNSLIKFDLQYFTYNGGANQATGIRVIRGTNIIWRPLFNATGPFSMNLNTGGAFYTTQYITFFDTPNSTSPQTYSLQYRTYNGGTAQWFARPGEVADYPASNYMIATEYAQ